MRLVSLNLYRFGLVLALVALLSNPSGKSGAVHRDDPSLTQLKKTLNSLSESVHRGDNRNTEQVCQGLLRDVSKFHRPDLETRILLLRGSAQLAGSSYLSALKNFLPARELSIKYKDYQDLYALNINIAWVYLEMNNLEVATYYADQAMVSAKLAHQRSASLMISRAFIYALSQDFPRAEALFSEADFYALNKGDIASAAAGWHLLGFAYFEVSREKTEPERSILLRKAQVAETEALRLRSIHHLPGIEESYRNLGSIYAGLGDLRTAEVLLDRAVSLMGDPRSTAPLWYFYFWRGWLRVQQGDFERALPDLRSSLDLARRLDVVPTDDDRVTFESGLADLYSLFIDAGNRLYLRNHDPALKAEVFEAAEENRAASLRALVPQPHGWRSRLPADYGVLLGRLQTAERQLLSNADHEPDAKTQSDVRLLRAALHSDEVEAGSAQETGRGSAIETARRAVDSDTVILAFHLGPRSSWLWTITDGNFEVYPLPPKSELAASAQQLTASIHTDVAWLEQSEALSKILFQQIPEKILARHRWIIALDQDLFSLPIAVLRLDGRFLAEQRSILLAPCIRLLEPAGTSTAINGPLLGVGDAIYNRADERFQRPALTNFMAGFWGAPDDLLPLARIVGSGEEVRTALSIWGSGKVLTGASSTRARLRDSLTSSTGILHLATHVIPAPQPTSPLPSRATVNNSRTGLIVLGLDASGQPGFLDMRDILLRPVNLRLVVMSGCASGDAAALPASGLMGLTRAWLGAGASEVLATRWPVIDDNGAFFSSFYRNLKANPSAGAPEALRAAQIEMIHSDSFRNRPEYWASYFLVGKV